MTKKMPWFSCYPDKWLAVLAELKPDVGYVYWVICLRIYEKGAAIPDTSQALARRTGYRPSHIDRIVGELIGLKKLFRTSDGALMNRFAEEELKSRSRRYSEKIDSTMADESPEKTQINQQMALPHIQLQEQRKKERKVPIPIPDDFTLDDPMIDFAVKRGWQEPMIIEQFSRFKRHHLGKATKWARWDLAWHTWVDNEIKWSAERQKTRGPINGNSKSVIEAGKRLLATMAGPQGVRPNGAGTARAGSAGNAPHHSDVRLLPER